MCAYSSAGAGREGNNWTSNTMAQSCVYVLGNLREKKFESKGLRSSLGGSHESGLG